MQSGGTFFEHFSRLSDPRVDRTKLHSLFSIIVITICAVICGADDWQEIEMFGNAKLPWFKTFLPLPNGIPSHDTFARVFSFLHPGQFEKCFQSWAQALAELTQDSVVAIDGKTVRRAHDETDGIRPLHLVSAFAVANGLTLAQQAVDKKSNEMKAIPKLLEILTLSGCIVTIDAGGCYPDVVSAIVAQKADYIIAVKRNQPKLHADVVKSFAVDVGKHSAYAKTEQKAHGRTEVRECHVLCGEEWISPLRTKDSWKQLSSIVQITSTRTVRSHTTTETRYYISSLSKGDAQQILDAIRSHWMIENSLHWILDIAFREDESRIRMGNAQENFALMRKIALNLLKQDKSVKIGIKGKRLNAGWDEAYLLRLLGV